MKTSLIAPFVLAFVLSPGFALAQTSFTDPSHASMDQITPGVNSAEPSMGNNAAQDQINAKQAAHDTAEDSQVWPTANAPKPATTTTSHHVNKKKHTTKKHTLKAHKKAAAATAPITAPVTTPAPTPAPVTPAQ